MRGGNKTTALPATRPSRSGEQPEHNTGSQLRLPVLDLHPVATTIGRLGLAWSGELRPAIEQALNALSLDTPAATLDVLAAAVAVVAHRYGGAPVAVTIRSPRDVRRLDTVLTPSTTFDDLLADIEGPDTSPPDTSPRAAEIELIEGPPPPDLNTASPGCRLLLGLHERTVWLAADTTALDTKAADRILGHVGAVLLALSADRSRPVVTVPILSQQETEQLDRWNDTGADYPLHLTFAEAFEAQVDRAPDRLAIVDGGDTLTYRQLDRQANAIAHALRQRGISPESVVGIMADRSQATQVAIVATLKCGAAFLPLDGKHPVQRNRSVLAACQPDLVLADPAFAPVATEAAVSEEEASAGPDTDILSLHSLAGLAPSADRIDIERRPDHLAYVIPTSGSTGVPKSAMVEQRPMMNHAWAMIDALGLTEDDVVGQSAPLTFDISVWQMLTPLLIGARVDYAPEAARSAPGRLLTWVDDAELTVLQLVPSLMSSVLQIAEIEPELHLAPSLRWVIPTGEALPPDIARRWLLEIGHQPLVNAYGPAECADDVTLAFIEQPPDADLRSVSIGHPVGNVATYVIDPYGGRLPIGILGEIHVGGACVGRGYRGDDERTADVFGPNPYPPFGVRYRTGDLGRFLADGSLEYVGRADHQVKIRGQRIELGEVESAVGSHPLVQQAIGAVVDGELVVFHQPTTTGDAVGTDELRAFVADRVPAHMWPQSFVPVEKVPLTPNGKVDRSSLAAMASAMSAGARRDRPVETAVTPTEEALTRIWARVLNRPVEGIGTADDFFDIGGTSLSAAIMLWNIDRDLDTDLPLSAPTERRTIAELAALIDELATGDGPADPARKKAASLVELAPGGDRIPLFVAPGQGGSVLGFVPLSRHLDQDQPFFGLDMQRCRDEDAPRQTFDSLVDHHLEAIRSRFPDGPYVVGGWCMGGEVAIELARRLRAEGEEVPLVVMLQTEHACYPTYPERMGRLGRALSQIMDRTGYEIETLRATPRSGWWTYISQQIVAKGVAKVTVPAEQLLARLAARVGVRFRGSEHFHRERWKVADGAAYDDYQCAPYDGDVLLITARQQPRSIVSDPTLGWQATVTGRLQVAEVDGYHWNILREPQIFEVADYIESALSALEPESSSPLASPNQGARTHDHDP
jgi:amino acid adenylation domain-containing protein